MKQTLPLKGHCHENLLLINDNILVHQAKDPGKLLYYSVSLICM